VVGSDMADGSFSTAYAPMECTRLTRAYHT